MEIQLQAFENGGVHPDYATVFRMILLLERLQIVHKVNLKRSCSYYELSYPGKDYDHVVCVDCGKVQFLNWPSPVAETERRLAEELGFTEVQHSLEFFGRCPECSEAFNSGVSVPGPAEPQVQL